MVYDSFIFEGHGYSEKTGGFDPGAINGSTTENSLCDKIVAAAKKHIAQCNLAIHYDENNYTDKDLAGNTYRAKAGISVHVNSAAGATGTEIIVPINEKYLTTDFTLVNEISSKLNIPNRGVKSRDYDSEQFIKRTDGVAVGGSDYYGETRDAWGRGISLAIIEVGFIGNDLNKIVANIDYIGYCVAKYVATLCGKTLKPYSAPTNTVVSKPATSTGTYRVVVDGASAGAYGVEENILKQVSAAVAKKAKKITIERV